MFTEGYGTIPNLEPHFEIECPQGFSDNKLLNCNTKYHTKNNWCRMRCTEPARIKCFGKSTCAISTHNFLTL